MVQFAEALKTLQQDEGGEMTQTYRPVAREKTVSLADCCALYRLRTLIESMQELLDIQASLDKYGLDKTVLQSTVFHCVYEGEKLKVWGEFPYEEHFQLNLAPIASPYSSNKVEIAGTLGPSIHSPHQ